MAQRKKIRIIFVSLFMILLCSSCSFLREAQLTSLMSEEGEKIEKQSNEIIRCLTESDRAGFESLFAEEIRNRESFQQEVDAVFDFFECDTYSKLRQPPAAETVHGLEKKYPGTSFLKLSILILWSIPMILLLQSTANITMSITTGRLQIKKTLI